MKYLLPIAPCNGDNWCSPSAAVPEGNYGTWHDHNVSARVLHHLRRKYSCRHYKICKKAEKIGLISNNEELINISVHISLFHRDHTRLTSENTLDCVSEKSRSLLTVGKLVTSSFLQDLLQLSTKQYFRSLSFTTPRHLPQIQWPQGRSLGGWSASYLCWHPRHVWKAGGA